MTELVVSLTGLLLALAIEGILLYFIVPMLYQVGAVRKNFRDKDIPVSVGITFPLSIMLTFLVYKLFYDYNVFHHLFLVAVLAMSFLGFIDDMLGQRDTMGFKGHFGALFKGRLTTGGLKALGGGVVALFLAVFIAGGWGNIILNVLIIALFTNMLNLLDLRPGRAIKGFLIFLLLIVLLAVGRIEWSLITPLLGAVVYYFPLDLKAGAMMGDAGSNVLGVALGFIAAVCLDLPVRVGVLVFLILMHLYTEKYSLTTTIERVKILKAIDMMGRRQVDD
ncbi:hypothetical protein [Syntrophomonas erecta]